MGYESRVYICQKRNIMHGDIFRDDIFYNILCAFKLAKIGGNFRDVFKNDIEDSATFYGIDRESDECIEEDNYGERPTVAKGEDVIKCLESGEYDGYWRAEIFKNTLKQAMKYINGDELYVVHMGY